LKAPVISSKSTQHFPELILQASTGGHHQRIRMDAEIRYFQSGWVVLSRRVLGGRSPIDRYHRSGHQNDRPGNEKKSAIVIPCASAVLLGGSGMIQIWLP
jgi:hypothetical protein